MVLRARAWLRVVSPLLLAALFAAPARGDAGVTLREIDNVARAHLERADALLAGGQSREAIENLLRVMDATDRVVRVDDGAEDGFERFVPVRQYVHLRLCALHETAPDALRGYRRQVDGQAERWYQQGLADRDEELLRRVVDRYFASSYGDDALYWLGEFALQRGEHTQARGHWQRISPAFRFPAGGGPQAERYAGLPTWLLLRDLDLDQHWQQLEPYLTAAPRVGNWLAYPDSDLDLDQVRARLVLVSIMEGNAPRARVELELLRRQAPQAEGRIANRQGRLVELLRDLLHGSQDWPPLPAPPGWTTWGGSPQRGRLLDRALDIAGAPLWEVPLARHSWLNEQGRADRLRVAEDARGLLSYHPLIVGDLVLVGTDADEIDIQAVRLGTGETAFPGGQDLTPVVYDNRHGRRVPRFVMTVEGNKIFVRLRASEPGDEPGAPPRVRTRLVALDIAAQRKLLFDVRLEPPAWDAGFVFEGPPVSDGAYLYVALRRRDDVRAEAHVACFDARQGRLKWRQFVAASDSPAVAGEPLPCNLLSLDEGVLYYNSNAGVVAALDARDGALRWVTKYPRALAGDEHPDRNDLHRYRDLNPCLVAGDVLLVAAADCRQLFALDAIEGRLLWSAPPELAADAVHLLGVAEGNLIASGECLYWLDAYSGRLRARFPDGFPAAQGHARPAPRGYGRGLLAGQQVYWPTRESIFVFPQRVDRAGPAGQPARVRRIELLPRGASGGNLVQAGGVLFIAAADRLYAFDQWGRIRDAANRRRASRAETERGLPADHR